MSQPTSMPPGPCPELTAIASQTHAEFSMPLSDGHHLLCQEILRLLPGRRITCRGIWNGQTVIAKIFIGKSAKRHARRDAEGTCALTEANIAAPALLYEGGIKGQSGQVLVYQWIADGVDAENIRDQGLPEQRRTLAENLIRIVARHHQAGLLQTDLYLRNFLCTDSTIHTLDGDGIRVMGDPLSWRQAMPNLALLLSKFDVEDDIHIPALLKVYCAHRNWQENTGMQKSLATKVSALRLDIARNYAFRKVLRNCTDVLVEQDQRHFLAISRTQSGNASQSWAKNPDAWLASPSCQQLKDGNTCTVGLIATDDRKIVIKRYNIKNFRHGLSRALRKTRASISWSNAHLLGILGIPTATPIALVEHRWGYVRRKSYFISEYVGGRDLGEIFADTEVEKELKQEIAMQAARLLHRMYRLGIEHGDLKSSNLKFADGTLYLLDLDAMRTHLNRIWFRSRHMRDLKRFLKNWQHCTATRQIMMTAIRIVYGEDPVLKMNEILT